MSVNPPKLELNQLIYRHLKEHGFHSAAEELQKQSPQGETNLSASLLDIYRSWLNDSKRQKQSDPTKHSAFKEKRKSIKASKKQTPTTPIQTRAEEDCGSHNEELSQSLLPQTPTASSKLYAPKTPIKTVTRSPDKLVKPGPLVQATPGDSSDTTDISEEAIRLPPVRQSKSNNDAPDQNKTGTAKKQMAIKDQTPKKQAVTVTTPSIGKAKKKMDKPAKKEQDPKKSVPVKRKKTGENTAITKKSKTSVKYALAEKDASDSDSSLDVEKWKKLLLNMTETDVAKMDAIDALDSSAPQPKKKRENKPRTKPSAKTDIQPPQNDRTSNDMDTVLVGDVAQTPAKSVKAKKKRAEKTASLNSSNAINPNTDTVGITPLSSIPSTVEEENVIVAAHSELTIDQKSKKKKIKKMTEDAGENFSNTVVDSIDNKEKKEKSEIPEKETCNSHVKKKNAKGNVDDRKEPIRNVELKTESIVQQKKLKKKKKNDEETLEQKTEGEINSEKMTEEENIEQTKKAKKKKKQKDKIDVDSAENTSREKDMQTEAAETEDNVGENNSEPISNKKKRKKKRKHHEGNLESVLEKNKFKEQEDQDNVVNPSECTDKGEQPAEANHKNKKCSSVKNDSVTVSPLLPSHEALGPPSEKKKKKKYKEVQESPVVPVQDASASLQTPLSSKNKKKKKASGSITGDGCQISNIAI